MSLWWLPVAAAAGAVARYLLDYTISRHARDGLPWGSFAVNVSGSLALGLLAGWVAWRGGSAEWGVLIGTGFLGAYTTFSTWMVETVRLWQQGRRLASVGHIAGSWAAGTAAAAAGLWWMAPG